MRQRARTTGLRWVVHCARLPAAQGMRSAWPAILRQECCPGSMSSSATGASGRTIRTRSSVWCRSRHQFRPGPDVRERSSPPNRPGSPACPRRKPATRARQPRPPGAVRGRTTVLRPGQCTAIRREAAGRHPGARPDPPGIRLRATPTCPDADVETFRGLLSLPEPDHPQRVSLPEPRTARRCFRGSAAG
jgi:hypothetical protein